MDQPQGRITRKLASLPPALLTLYAIPVAFGAYFCMYAFRKPYQGATWELDSYTLIFGSWSHELGYKAALVISQVLGYALSKLLGIKFCSEVSRRRRLAALVGTVLMAEAALLLFAVTDERWRFAVIFFNGIPLGMVWGLVVRYLEGRQTSELLLAGLSCSYILASGVVKDVGRWLMSEGFGGLFGFTSGVPEAWMPAATGAMFFLPFLLFVWLLNQVPPPTRQDERIRTVRESMDGTHRWAFFLHFFWGMAMVTVAYFFMTAYRDFRDIFAVEIYAALGYAYETNKTIISRTELIVAFGVMLAMALIYLVKNNRRGLATAYAIMVGGLLLLGGSTLLFDAHLISGFTWMTLAGLGVYLAYVPFGAVLFDRLIASTHVVATAVFAVYFTDAVGYGGSVGVLLWKEFFFAGTTPLEFFRQISYFLCISGSLLMGGSCLYFLYGHPHYHVEDETRVQIPARPHRIHPKKPAQPEPQPALVGEKLIHSRPSG